MQSKKKILPVLLILFLLLFSLASPAAACLRRWKGQAVKSSIRVHQEDNCKGEPQRSFTVLKFP